MTRWVKKRVLIAVAAILLVALGGALGGYMLGCAAVWRLTEEKLLVDASTAADQFITIMDESTSLLKSMNASHGEFCSDSELAGFRDAVFHAQKLKDAGRMQDGIMDCSALFGKEHLSEETFHPTLTIQNGVKVYIDLPPYRSDTWRAYIFQQGNSYVVETSERAKTFQRSEIFYESTLVDAVSHQRVRPSGLAVEYPDAILDHDTRGRLGELLYVTECEPHSDMCTSAFTSISVQLRNNRMLLGLYAALGGVSCAFVGMLLFLTHLRRHDMARQLRRAIGRAEVGIVYQPIVDLASGKMVGAEALARWKDEEGYAVNPEVFVGLAEEHGFVGELTALVVRTVLLDLGVAMRLESGFRVNVNATGTDLKSTGFLTMLKESLEQAGVEPARLAIEVTEGSTVRNPTEIRAIGELSARGHSVQIDDFGTGYSSLAYLKDLKVDTIKIDKAFTRSIGTEAVTLGILPQILAMADTLHLQVIVEGIETVEQAAYFAGKARPVFGQGWHFGKPMAAEELLRLLLRQAQANAASLASEVGQPEETRVL
jgi:sensor c-di-GMP phosphodiesterase-like protein